MYLGMQQWTHLFSTVCIVLQSINFQCTFSYFVSSLFLCSRTFLRQWRLRTQRIGHLKHCPSRFPNFNRSWVQNIFSEIQETDSACASRMSKASESRAWNCSRLRLGFRCRMSSRFLSSAAINWLLTGKLRMQLRIVSSRPSGATPSKTNNCAIVVVKNNVTFYGKNCTVCLEGNGMAVWILNPAPVGQPKWLKNCFCIAVNPQIVWIVDFHLCN